MQEISNRKKIVLRWIVRSHIETAQPVGSSHLVSKYHLEYSPATVRKEMADLEEMEYIKQPHTSAGRVPTDKGYRFYVDGLMRRESLSLEEQERILKWMEDSGRDVNSP